MVASVVKCVLSPFEVNMNTGDPQGIKLNLQAKKLDRQGIWPDIYFIFKCQRRRRSLSHSS